MCQTAISNETKIAHLQRLFTEINTQYSLGYTFVLGNKKRSLGTCNWGKKWIIISRNYLQLPLEELEDTLKHEFAHALDARERGYSKHDNNWRKWCYVVGCRPNRTTNVPKELRPEPKYYWVCSEHGRLRGAHRKSNAFYRCAKCKTQVHLMPA
jgi:predicted SprT family Zn-dependent metalloprotease